MKMWTPDELDRIKFQTMSFQEACEVVANIRALQAKVEFLEKRLPLCPPCDIGENTEYICEAELIPKHWANRPKLDVERVATALEDAAEYIREIEQEDLDEIDKNERHILLCELDELSGTLSPRVD